MDKEKGENATAFLGEVRQSTKKALALCHTLPHQRVRHASTALTRKETGPDFPDIFHVLPAPGEACGKREKGGTVKPVARIGQLASPFNRFGAHVQRPNKV